MKFASYLRDGVERIGIVHSNDKRVFDLTVAARRQGADGAQFKSMLALIDADTRGLDAARDLFARRGAEPDLSHTIAEIELEAPLPRPRQMRDAMCFPSHIRQSARGARAFAAKQKGGEEAFKAAMAAPLDDVAPVYRQIPIYYIANRLVVTGPGATIKWPRYGREMDYELELGIVTKRPRANIPADEAREHIFGYTIFNDFSARDRQRLETQGRLGPSKGKSFDGANVIGPWLVTPDEIGDPQALRAEVRINGETRSQSTTAGMLHSFEEILAYVSQDETIFAGEFFGSGTIGGCSGVETGRLLEDGDMVELEIERIGVLKNKVIRQDMA